MKLCPGRDTVKRKRRQAMGWEKVLVKDTSDRGLMFKIQKELLKCNRQKPNNPLAKLAEDLNQRRQTANKSVKRCSTS